MLKAKYVETASPYSVLACGALCQIEADGSNLLVFFGEMYWRYLSWLPCWPTQCGGGIECGLTLFNRTRREAASFPAKCLWWRAGER